MPQSFAEELSLVPKSPNLAASLKRAQAYARAGNHALVTLEHLLLALSEDAEAAGVLNACNVDIDRLRADVAAYLGRLGDGAGSGGGEPVADKPLLKIMEYAAAAAKKGTRPHINGAVVLAAIVGEGQTNAADLLKAQGLTFKGTIEALRQAGQQQEQQTDPAPAAANPAVAEAGRAETPSAETPSPETPSTEAPSTETPSTEVPAAEAAMAAPAPAAVHNPQSTDDILASVRERLADARRAAQATPVVPRQKPVQLERPDQLASKPAAEPATSPGTVLVSEAAISLELDPKPAAAAAAPTAAAVTVAPRQEPQTSQKPESGAQSATAAVPGSGPDQTTAPAAEAAAPTPAAVARVPEAPVPEAPVPKAPMPQSPVSQAPAPQARAPQAPASQTQASQTQASQVALEQTPASHPEPQAPQPDSAPAPYTGSYTDALPVERQRAEAEAHDRRERLRAEYERRGRGERSRGMENGPEPIAPWPEPRQPEFQPPPAAPNPAPFDDLMVAAPPASGQNAAAAQADNGAFAGPPFPSPDDITHAPGPMPNAASPMPAPMPAPVPMPIPMPVGEAAAPLAQPAAPPQQLPPPPQSAPSKPRQQSGTEVEVGQLLENIPRAMRVGVPETVEVRIAREGVSQLQDGMQGHGTAQHHDLLITKAMSVKLKAPTGAFWVETASPETQWIDNKLGVLRDDFASWRWTVTPRRRGRSRLQIVVSARTVGSDGLAAETQLPYQVINVKVKVNYKKTFKRLGGWAVAALFGGGISALGSRFLSVDALKGLIKLVGL